MSLSRFYQTLETEENLSNNVSVYWINALVKFVILIDISDIDLEGLKETMQKYLVV